MNEENKHIKPCPFCGNTEDPVHSTTRVFYHSKKTTIERSYYLKCDDCDLTIGLDEPDYYGDRYNEFGTEQEALNFWNKRVNETDDSK